MKELVNHHKDSHSDLKPYVCTKCSASFQSKELLNYHVSFVHRDISLTCEYCDKKFKLKHHLSRHIIKVHLEPFPRRVKTNNNIKSRSQFKIRERKTVTNIINQIKSFPEANQKSILITLIKENPNILKTQFKNNPLTEADVIEMIIDNSIPDLVMFNILKTLRKKWGMCICIKNMRKLLVERKQIFKPYFKNVLLNEKSELQFKDTKDNILPRYVTYCSDIKAVAAILKDKIPMLSSEEYVTVVAIDGGKNNLKICLNWSKKKKIITNGSSWAQKIV